MKSAAVKAGESDALQGDGVGAVEGDHHIRPGLDHMALDRGKTAEGRGGEIDRVMAGTGSRRSR